MKTCGLGCLGWRQLTSRWAFLETVHKSFIQEGDRTKFVIPWALHSLE